MRISGPCGGDGGCYQRIDPAERGEAIALLKKLGLSAQTKVIPE